MLKSVSFATIKRQTILRAALFTLLAATTLTAQITVTPSALLYKATEFTTSSPKNVLVTNTGAAAITFGAGTIIGTDAGDFGASSDTCSNHTIAPGKNCKIGLTFSATQPVGSVASATLNINDNLGNSLQQVSLSGTVVRGSIRATISGLTVTIINPKTTQYSADWSTTGPYTVDNSQTTCVDVIFNNASCVIVLARTGNPAPGELTIRLGALQPGGKSVVFHVPLN